MHPHKKEALLKKGWTESEVKKAETLLERTELHDVIFSKITFWSALVVIIFANLLVSIILIPFLIVLDEWILYFTIIVLAGTIGFLYNFLITDIRHLDRRHHTLAGIIVPLLAIFNMIAMVLISNDIIDELKVKTPLHNPWLIGLVFAIAFVIPYLIERIRGKHYFEE